MITSDMPIVRRTASTVSAVSSTDSVNVSAVTLLAMAVSVGKRTVT